MILLYFIVLEKILELLCSDFIFPFCLMDDSFLEHKFKSLYGK